MLGAVLGSACRIDPIGSLDTEEHEASWNRVEPMIPWVNLASQGVVGWEAAVRNHLAVISGPQASGRRPGSDGARFVQRLAVATFEEAALTPDGVGRAWLAPVELQVATDHRVALQVDLPQDGAASSEVLLDAGIYVRRGGRTEPVDQTLELVGIPAAEHDVGPHLVLAELEVVVDESLDGLLTRADAIFRRAASADAFGCLIELPAGPLRPVLLESWLVPEVSLSDLPREHGSLAFYGFIDAAALDVLRAAQDAKRPVFTHVESDVRHIHDANVLGRIVGETDPAEVVMVLAHWDAGGFSPPLPHGGAILDNGSGLAVLFAAAEISGRWMSLGRRPRRSIVFGALTAGSLDDLGAPRVMTIPGLEPKYLTAVVNLDTLDWRGPTLRARDGDRSMLGAFAQQLDASVSVEPSTARFAHRVFLDAQVPAMTLQRLGPPNEPSMQGSLDGLARDAEFVFRLAWELADRPSTEPSAPVVEVERVR